MTASDATGNTQGLPVIIDEVQKIPDLLDEVQSIVVSRDRESRITEDGIEILPWKRFLEMLWQLP